MNSANDSKQHLYGLDGLKAIGCLLVAFFWHYQHFGAEFTPPLYNVFFLLYQSGGIAVELFLMISGFAMQMTYFERIKSHQIAFPQYIVRRMRKIWPIAMVTLLVVTAGELWYRSLSGVTFVVGNFDLYHFVLNCALLQAGWWENSYSFNSPAWFISTLLLCYIIYFFLVRAVGKSKKLFYGLCLGIVFTGFVCLITGSQLPFLHAGFAARGYICFYGGVLLYEQYTKRIRLSVWATPVIGGIVFVLLVVVQRMGIVSELNLRQLLCILVLFPLLIISACCVDFIERIFCIRPLMWLSSISMDVFLWHFPVQLFIACISRAAGFAINYGSILFFGGYVLVVMLVASISNSASHKLIKA